MILSTLSSVEGNKIIEQFGIVAGNCVRAPSASDDVMTGLKGLVGGEIKKLTKILSETRHEATERMIEEAKGLNANAILNVRYTANTNIVGAIELFVYGTAVKLER